MNISKEPSLFECIEALTDEEKASIREQTKREKLDRFQVIALIHKTFLEKVQTEVDKCPIIT